MASHFVDLIINHYNRLLHQQPLEVDIIHLQQRSIVISIGVMDRGITAQVMDDHHNDIYTVAAADLVMHSPHTASSQQHLPNNNTMISHLGITQELIQAIRAADETSLRQQAVTMGLLGTSSSDEEMKDDSHEDAIVDGECQTCFEAYQPNNPLHCMVQCSNNHHQCMSCFHTYLQSYFQGTGNNSNRAAAEASNSNTNESGSEGEQKLAKVPVTCWMGTSCNALFKQRHIRALAPQFLGRYLQAQREQHLALDVHQGLVFILTCPNNSCGYETLVDRRVSPVPLINECRSCNSCWCTNPRCRRLVFDIMSGMEEHDACIDRGIHTMYRSVEDILSSRQVISASEGFTGPQIQDCIRFIKECIRIESPHCPSCETPAFKTYGGCNAVTCTATIARSTCGTSFCFVCSKQLIYNPSSYLEQRLLQPAKVACMYHRNSYNPFSMNLGHAPAHGQAQIVDSLVNAPPVLSYWNHHDTPLLRQHYDPSNPRAVTGVCPHYNTLHKTHLSMKAYQQISDDDTNSEIKATEVFLEECRIRGLQRAKHETDNDDLFRVAFFEFCDSIDRTNKTLLERIGLAGLFEQVNTANPQAVSSSSSANATAAAPSSSSFAQTFIASSSTTSRINPHNTEAGRHNISNNTSASTSTATLSDLRAAFRTLHDFQPSMNQFTYQTVYRALSECSEGTVPLQQLRTQLRLLMSDEPRLRRRIVDSLPQ